MTLSKFILGMIFGYGQTSWDARISTVSRLGFLETLVFMSQLKKKGGISVFSRVFFFLGGGVICDPLGENLGVIS